MARADSHATGARAYGGPVAPGHAWARHLGFGAQTVPVADGEVIYLPTGSQLHAVDLDTGLDRWQIDLRHFIAGLALADDAVLAFTDDGTVSAVDPVDGDVLAEGRSIAPDGRVSGAGLLIGGRSTVVIPVGARIYAFSPDLQTLLWTWSPSLAPGYRGPSVVGPPSADRTGRILVPCTVGSLYALDEDDGTIVWHYGERSFAVPFTAVVDEDNRVFWLTASHQEHRQALVCLDGYTGAVLWSTELATHTYADLAVAAGRVLLVSADGVLSCFVSDSGQLAWRAELSDRLDRPVFDAPLIIDGQGRVYTAVRDTVYCFGLADGMELFRIEVEGHLDARHLILPVDGCLFVTLGGGHAYLLRDPQ